MEKEVSISVKCPLCSRSLMVDDFLIRNKPAIKLNVETEQERGVLWLSSVYGDNTKEMDINIADGEIVDMYCPHCNKELTISESCSECGAPLVSFVIKAGGVVRICSRKGCHNHHIVFKDIGSELSKFYFEYGF
ncbi:MAG: hypothetical protein H3C41_08860 [Bacteroidales bacterium]|nr:hypothetical protein [Bacteroidales bacterium]